MAKTPTYRELQSKLDDVLAKLEDPSLDIDEAATAHADGLKLVKQLQEHLEQTENKITKAQADFSEA